MAFVDLLFFSFVNHFTLQCIRSVLPCLFSFQFRHIVSSRTFHEPYPLPIEVYFFLPSSMCTAFHICLLFTVSWCAINIVSQSSFHKLRFVIVERVCYLTNRLCMCYYYFVICVILFLVFGAIMLKGLLAYVRTMMLVAIVRSHPIRNSHIWHIYASYMNIYGKCMSYMLSYMSRICQHI